MGLDVLEPSYDRALLYAGIVMTFVEILKPLMSGNAVVFRTSQPSVQYAFHPKLRGLGSVKATAYDGDEIVSLAMIGFYAPQLLAADWEIMP